MRVLLKYSLLFLIIIVPGSNAVSKSAARYQPPVNGADSVKYVQVYVFAKERALNYDSLFRSQAFAYTSSDPGNNFKKDTSKKIAASTQTPSPASRNEIAAAIKSDQKIAQKKSEFISSKDQIAAFSHANKADCLWIGGVLIVAGIILGILLGRTAYLVSVVGAVFIVLGFTVAG